MAVPTRPMTINVLERTAVLMGAISRLDWMKPNRPNQVSMMEGIRFLPMTAII